MGQPNPDEPPYCKPDCNEFPPDETPCYALMVFSGIMKGDNWTPYYGEPPNGTYLAVYGSECSWSSIHPGWIATIGWDEQFLVALEHAAFGVAFSQYSDEPFPFTLENIVQDPNDTVWYGGSCTVTPFSPSQHVNFDLNFYSNEDAKTELVTDNGPDFCLKTAYRPDGTNILALLEF